MFYQRIRRQKLIPYPLPLKVIRDCLLDYLFPFIHYINAKTKLSCFKIAAKYNETYEFLFVLHRY